MKRSVLYIEVDKITQEIQIFLEEQILPLNESQLNWKKNTTSWSIREVFAHLNEFAKYYHSAFSKKIDTTRYHDPGDVFISSPLGKSMWKAIKLGNANNIKRKMKSHKLFNPLIVTSIVTNHVIRDFYNSQKELVQIIERSKKINLRKARIRMANHGVIKFRFGDALLYLAYHNQRHIQQVKTILAHPNFPKS